MAGFWDRALRVILGVVLIWLGVRMASTGGYILAVIGLVPLLAGLFDLCPIAPLFGLPLRGKDVLSMGVPQAQPQQ